MKAIKKLHLGPGPWQDEPDFWEEYNVDGIGRLPDCYRIWAERNETGVWCGFLDLPVNHPWVGKSVEDLADIPVHGGITFAARTRNEKGWTIGFECAENTDLVPRAEVVAEQLNLNIEGGKSVIPQTYRDLDYVKLVCSFLVGYACAFDEYVARQ